MSNNYNSIPLDLQKDDLIEIRASYRIPRRRASGKIDRITKNLDFLFQVLEWGNRLSLQTFYDGIFPYLRNFSLVQHKEVHWQSIRIKDRGNSSKNILLYSIMCNMKGVLTGDFDTQTAVLFEIHPMHVNQLYRTYLFGIPLNLDKRLDKMIQLYDPYNPENNLNEFALEASFGMEPLSQKPTQEDTSEPEPEQDPINPFPGIYSTTQDQASGKVEASRTNLSYMTVQEVLLKIESFFTHTLLLDESHKIRYVPLAKMNRDKALYNKNQFTLASYYRGLRTIKRRKRKKLIKEAKKPKEIKNGTNGTTISTSK